MNRKGVWRIVRASAHEYYPAGEKMFNKCHTDYRALIVGAETKIPLHDGQRVTSINFDNAATTPPFLSVLQSVVVFFNT